MSKQYKHWCDKSHEYKETNFDTGDLAHKVVNILTDWVLHDSTITTDMNDVQITLMRERMISIIELAEEIECQVIDANSIYAVYDIDFQLRRKLLISARGKCFRLTTKLRHVVNYVHQSTNIQKYLDIEKDVEHLANMIKNIMIKDDKRRKTQSKKYTTDK